MPVPVVTAAWAETAAVPAQVEMEAMAVGAAMPAQAEMAALAPATAAMVVLAALAAVTAVTVALVGSGAANTDSRGAGGNDNAGATRHILNNLTKAFSATRRFPMSSSGQCMASSSVQMTR